MEQTTFMRDIYSINEGCPPEVNLVNEKNNGLAVSKLINDNLISSCHDVFLRWNNSCSCGNVYGFNVGFKNI